jgi:hypothetical protein
LALDDKGNTSLLNYTVTRGFYVTDRVVRRAALVIGVNGKDRRLIIERKTS